MILKKFERVGRQKYFIRIVKQYSKAILTEI